MLLSLDLDRNDPPWMSLFSSLTIFGTKTCSNSSLGIQLLLNLLVLSSGLRAIYVPRVGSTGPCVDLLWLPSIFSTWHKAAQPTIRWGGPELRWSGAEENGSEYRTVDCHQLLTASMYTVSFWGNVQFCILFKYWRPRQITRKKTAADSRPVHIVIFLYLQILPIV